MTRELVLTLHGLGEPPRHIDKDEAKFWGCTEAFGALLDRCRDAKVGNGSATVLTFDDAHLSHATVALPRLVEKGLSGIFFVCAGRIGQKDCLDRAALIDMLAAGMEIGTHGMDHVDWRQLDGLAKVREYDDARACIEDICGRKITKAAIPYGYYSRQVLEDLKMRPYQHVYTCDRGFAQSNLWLKPRNTLERTTSAKETDDLFNNMTPLFVKLRRRAAAAAKAMR